MYRVLCYGDSNTWGYNPANGLRFSEGDRWPGVLRRNLGAGFEIIEDGKNGRRVLGDVAEFSSSLGRNNPLDVILIYLGVNDICFEKDVRVDDIIDGLAKMLEIVRQNYLEIGDAAPEVILMGAVPVNEAQIKDCFYDIEVEKVVRYSKGLRSLASRAGCGFIETGRIIESSSLDGIHLEAGEHKKLGLFVADYARIFLTNTNLNNKN
ncbi:MAG TPA: hypothetical protein DCO79_12275 [Spirochaeta sp.]|nr:hypothetical protein [Spirochaeta sp.]